MSSAGQTWANPQSRLTHLLPPAWFAAVDAVLTRQHPEAWSLACRAIAGTACVLALALGPLARRRANWATAFLSSPSAQPRPGSIVLRALRRTGLAGWGLRSSAARAAFTLTTLYLIRSRDVIFRLGSTLSPVCAMPLLLFIVPRRETFLLEFGIATMGIYLGVYAFLAVQMIEVSHDWRAAEIFGRVPLAGPAELCRGARRAVLTVAVPPIVAFYIAVVWWVGREGRAVTLLLPGLLAIPLYAYLPNLLGRGVPLVAAPSGGEAANLLPVLARWTFQSLPFAAGAALVYRTPYFWLLLGLELAVLAVVWAKTRGRLERLCWRSQPGDMD